MYKIINKTKDYNLIKLLALVMVFISFGFIATVIPSGGRFLTIAYLVALFLLLKIYVKFRSSQLQTLIKWGIPIFSFKIFFGIIYLSYSLVSSTLWFGNLFWILYEGIGFEVDYYL